MKRNLALRIAGLFAIGTALYHGIAGDGLIVAMEMSEADLGLVRAFTHIGTTGWLAGGVLLFAAGGFDSQQARNWIVGVLTVLYGIPAMGQIAMSGGVSLGGILLVSIIVFALIGRSKDDAVPNRLVTA